MLDPLWLVITVAFGLAAVAAAAWVGYLAGSRRRRLDSASDLAGYRILHLAAQVGAQLRSGLTVPAAAPATRYLRLLLEVDAVALTTTDQTLALSATKELLALKPQIVSLTETARSTGRLQVLRFAAHNTSPDEVPGEFKRAGVKFAVVAPLHVEQVVVGALVALHTHSSGSSAPPADLVRACTELAQWISSQLHLAQLGEAKARLMEAELKALRAQISPHFIYNSLNAISSYVVTDPQRARELLVEFADFTRYSFRQNAEFTTVAEELQSIDRYLLLEHARFGDRLNVSLQISPEALSTPIPFLSLQPLVENAVKHGIESKPGAGHITIKAHELGAFTQISIEDDGVGMDPSEVTRVLAGVAGSEHIGLKNVDARLRQAYGDEHGLIVDTGVDAGTLITLTVPKFHTNTTPLRNSLQKVTGPVQKMTGQNQSAEGWIRRAEAPPNLE